MDTLQEIRVELNVPFMQRFNAALIQNPQVVPKDHVLGRDPFWKSIHNAHILIDPATDNALGFWDSSHNQAFIFGEKYGYLKHHPTNPEVFQFSYDPFENPFKDKSEGLSLCKKDVLTFTHDYDLDALLSKAPLLIQHMIQGRSLALEGAKDVSANAKMLIDYILVTAGMSCFITNTILEQQNIFQGDYYKKFEDLFGYNLEGLRLNLWPKREEANILLKKLDLISPGITEFTVEDPQDTSPRNFKIRMYRRMENDNQKRRRTLEKEMNVQGINDELPRSKRRRTDSNDQGLQQDEYGATNYKPPFTEDGKKRAEAALLGNSTVTSEELFKTQSLFEETRTLQRHCVEILSVKGQLEKFPWLESLEYQLKNFQWIMTGLFENQSTLTYLKTKAGSFLSKSFRFFKQRIQKQSQSLLSTQPENDSPLAEKFIFTLQQLDDLFEADIIQRVETTLTSKEAAMASGTPIPTLLFLGRGYQNIVVAVDGILIGQFQREDVLEAHCCQYGALYNFGISYEVKSDGSKTSAGVRDFYDFLSKYLWGTGPWRRNARGKVVSRKVSNRVSQLWNDINKLDV